MTEPIACSLEAGSYKQRMDWIKKINEAHLLEHHREGTALRLSYRLQARDMIRKLMLCEQACCPFLGFSLQRHADRVVFTIQVPEAGRDAADDLLAPFLRGVDVDRENHGENRGVPTGQPIDPNTVRFSSAPFVSSLSTAVAAGALACGVSCILPLMFPAVASTTVGAAIAWFGHAHMWFTALALVLVSGGWVWIWRKASRAHARPGRPTMFLMSMATIATFLALVWPHIESRVFAFLTS